MPLMCCLFDMGLNTSLLCVSHSSLLVLVVGYECSTAHVPPWIRSHCYVMAVPYVRTTGNHGDTEAVHLEVPTLYGGQSQVCE